MKFPCFRLYALAILYLVVPIFIFLLTWLRPLVGIVAVIGLTAGIFFLLREIRIFLGDTCCSLNRYNLTAFVLVFFFLLSTAHGGFVGTVGIDIPYRDAMYHDLITYPWPLTYEFQGESYAFVYYHAFWLVPAGISYLLELGWGGSHVLLFIWTYLGLCLSVQILCDLFRVQKKQALFISLLFLFWSAPCLLGMILKSIFAQTALYIPDTPGMFAWQFAGGSDHGFRLDYFTRTTRDAIENTYNQYVAIYLVSAMCLRFRFIWHVMIGICFLLLPFSPFGFVGLSLLLGGWLLCDGIRAVGSVFHKDAGFIAITLFPIYSCYYLSNSMVNSGGSDASILYVPFSAYGFLRVGSILLYVLLYYAGYLYLVKWNFLGENRLRYWWLLLLAILLTVFKIGSQGDLLWGGSGPIFFVVMVLVMKQIMTAWEKHLFWGKDLALAILLGIAVLTPCMQMVSTFRGCVLAKSIMVYPDPHHVDGTFIAHEPDEIGNFLAGKYENTIFYKYLAKEEI